jgi:hypothetical protein
LQSVPLISVSYDRVQCFHGGDTVRTPSTSAVS